MTDDSTDVGLSSSLFIAFHIRDDSQLNAISQNLEDLFTRYFPDAHRRVFASAEQREIIFEVKRPVFHVHEEQANFFTALEYIFNVTAMHLPQFTHFQEVDQA